MDDALWAVTYNGMVGFVGVLILVLVDDTLWLVRSYTNNPEFGVLILVIVDDTLWSGWYWMYG